MEQFLIDYWWLVILLGLWTLPWTGWALWRSARLNQMWWFVILLVVNTAGLLEILYLFVFSRKKDLNINKR